MSSAAFAEEVTGIQNRVRRIKAKGVSRRIGWPIKNLGVSPGARGVSLKGATGRARRRADFSAGFPGPTLVRSARIQQERGPNASDDDDPPEKKARRGRPVHGEQGTAVRFRQRNSAKHKAEPSEVPRYYGARGKRQRPGKESRGRLPIIGVGGARARVSLKRGDGKSTEAGRFPRPGAGSRPGRAPPRKRSRRNGSQTRPGERDDEDTRQK